MYPFCLIGRFLLIHFLTDALGMQHNPLGELLKDSELGEVLVSDVLRELEAWCKSY